MIKNLNEGYFKSSDLSLVSVLRLLGYKTIIGERQGKQVIFYIKKDKGIDSMVNNYWGHKLKVDPLLYFNTLKETKGLIYQRY
jgi:hypothetical protein